MKFAIVIILGSFYYWGLYCYSLRHPGMASQILRILSKRVALCGIGLSLLSIILVLWLGHNRHVERLILQILIVFVGLGAVPTLVRAPIESAKERSEKKARKES